MELAIPEIGADAPGDGREDPMAAVAGRVLAHIAGAVGCDTVALAVRSGTGPGRITQASGAALASRAVAAGFPGWQASLSWPDIASGDVTPPAGLPGTGALLAHPVTLGPDREGVLICHAREPGSLGAAEMRALAVVAPLAGEALAAGERAAHNALLASVSENSAAAIAIADATTPDMPLIHVNDAFSALTGYDRTEVLGRNCRFLDAEAPGSPERARLRETVRARGEGTFELLNRRRDGELFWCRLTLYPVRHACGAARLMVATQVDITAAREARLERDAARERLVDALSAIPHGVLLLDPAGRVVFANESFGDLFCAGGDAFAPGSDVEAAWRACFEARGFGPHEARAEAARRREQLFAGGGEREENLPDGRAVLVTERSPAEGGAVCVATEITEVKSAERKLAQRAAALDAARDGVALTDAGGRFIYMNRAHLALFGYEGQGEVLGRPWSILYTPEQADWMEREAIPVLLRDGAWRGEVEGRRRDGVPVHQEVSLSYLEGVGIVCVTRDIGERLKAERERARLREQLDAAQRQEAIGELAAGVAHDFNNLLAVIAGSAALAGAELDEADPRAEHVGRITAAAERARALVAGLLEVGGRRSVPCRLDLRESVREAADLLRAGLAEPARLVRELPDGPVHLHADPSDVLQVLLNLGVNARDALGAAGGEVRVSLATATPMATPDDLVLGQVAPGRSVAVLSVSDTGMGIEPGRAHEIFRPYVTTKGARGTGLGLAVVARIVRKVGGAVALSSAPGCGSRFRVYWPLTPGRGTRLAGRTVLLCLPGGEGAAAAAALEASGAEVARCEDARDARAALEEDPEAWSLAVLPAGRLSGALPPAPARPPVLALGEVQADMGACAIVALEPDAPAEALVEAAARAIETGAAGPGRAGGGP